MRDIDDFDSTYDIGLRMRLQDRPFRGARMLSHGGRILRVGSPTIGINGVARNNSCRHITRHVRFGERLQLTYSTR